MTGTRPGVVGPAPVGQAGLVTGIKESLHAALRENRAALVAKLDGLSEADRRRPLTPTGTNLLGLVKHLAGVELGYLGESFGRPPERPLPWYADGSVWEGADMWATAEESTEEILETYRKACEHSDRTLAELDLDAVGSVAWWDEESRATDLGTILVRVLVDTARHAGQADIVRELIDGRGGDDQESFGDEQEWAAYVGRIAAAAASFEE